MARRERALMARVAAHFMDLRWTISVGLIACASASVSQSQAQIDQRPARSVFPDELAFTADVTTDGRAAVLFTQPYGRGTKDLPSRIEIRNLRTHAKTILAGGPSPVGTPGRPAGVFSPDGKYVAYTWLDAQLTDTGMLQLIGTNPGASPRTLIPADPSDQGIIPHAWSPDGKRILVLIHGASTTMATDPTSIAWVSVADGSLHIIKVLEPWRDGGMALPRLSPDGKLIAYSARPQEGSRDRHIYVIDAKGENEMTVASLPGSSTAPVWTPDRTHVVFVNRQEARSELFAVPVQRGELARGPVRLRTGFSGEPIRISRTGALYYWRFGGGVTEFIAPLTSAGDRSIRKYEGYGAVWPQQQALVYIRGDREVITHDLITGEQRAYWHTSVPVFPPKPLRNNDGAILYVFPFGDGGRPGGAFYRVDFSSGRFERLWSKDTAEHTRSTVTELSRDDRALYLGMTTAQGTWTGIVAVDVKTGAEETVVTFPDAVAVQGMALSPDGSTFALHTLDGRIVTVRVDGTDYKEICGPTPGGGWRDVIRWSPDGRFILFATRLSPTASSWRLMKVPVAGGISEFAGVDSSILSPTGPLTSFDISPDGSRVALSVRTPMTFDMSILENVMAVSPSSK
jgi:Tol biopolymer transport system component